MGRGKLDMELIANEKPRMTTYRKRKKGLIKKAEEFHTLCDVETCVIIFGPKQKDGPAEVETFPKESSEVRRIINSFKGKPYDDVSNTKNTFSLSQFFDKRKKKVESDISKLHKANVEARFPSWDDRFDVLSLEQLRCLYETFDKKLKDAKSVLMMKRGEHFLMEDSKSGISFCGPNTQFNLNIPNFIHFEDYNQQQLISSSMKPSNTQLSAYFSSDQALQIQHDLTVDPMKMLMMNDDDYTQYGGGVSRSNIPYTQLKSPAYYDPKAAMIENVVYNPRSLSMCYYGPTIQPTVPYGQQVMPNASSHVNVSHFDEFCRIMNVKDFRHED